MQPTEPQHSQTGQGYTFVHSGRPNRTVPYLDPDPPPETLGNLIRETLHSLMPKLSKRDAITQAMPEHIPRCFRRNE